jgi:hypothetical protein
MTSLSRFLLGVALFLTAPFVSAQQGDLSRSNTSAHSFTPRRTPSLPISYDSALNAQGFPSPLVKAEIAGHEALFIVDSGASVNVLADWYAKVAEIPAGEAGSTATGATAIVVRAGKG